MKKYFLALRNLIILVFFLYLIGLIINEIRYSPRPLPVIPLPDREIAITVYKDKGGRDVVFMHPDGSGVVEAPYFNPGWDIEWSPAGTYLGVNEPETAFPNPAGYPVLIAQDGSVIRCPRTTGYQGLRFLSETSLAFFYDEDHIQKIVQYEMTTCTRGEEIFQSQPYEQILDFDISSQGWLAVTVGNRDEYSMRIYDREQNLVSEVSQARSQTWSRDGEWIAFQFDLDWQVCQAVFTNKYLQVIEEFETNPPNCNNIYAWSPDNRELIYSYGAGLAKLNLETGESTVLHPEGYAATWR